MAKKDNGAMRALSDLVQRVQLAARAGLQHGSERDLYKTFGYQRHVRVEDILSKYERQDIVARIVDAPPKATWAGAPIVRGESEEFARIWKRLVRRHKLWTVFQRADRMAAMGRYSGILIGFNDGQEAEQPVNRSDNLDILYLQVIGEHNTTITQFETDDRQPRFGKPKSYNIQFDDPASKQVVGSDVRAEEFRSLHTHWERVLHITENPLHDDTFATPRVLKIYNLLDDLLKVAGGTSETYWLTSNRGMQADVDKDMDLSEEDAKDLSDELDEYMHELRRIIRTRGVKVNSLGADTPSPGETFDMLLSLIAGAEGIPKRVLMGSEQGSLASEQDRANWADRIDERKADFAQPGILEPFIDRLIDVGILPDEEYDIEWPDSFKMSPLERAQTMAQKGRSAANLAKQLNEANNVLDREEARRILAMEGSFLESTPSPEPTRSDDSADE